MIPETVDMTPVISGNVRAIGYSDLDSQLYVSFSTGFDYVYFDVPRSVFDDFLAAPSKGSFLRDVIKGGGYRYEKV